MLNAEAWAAPGSAQPVLWPQHLFIALSIIFALGFMRSLWRSWRARLTLRRQLLAPAPALAELQQLAAAAGRAQVRFVILIPAKSESRVIANTMQHLASLRYDPSLFSVYVITDSRECPAAGEPLTFDVARQCSQRLNQLLGRDLFHVLSIPDDYVAQRQRGVAPALASSKGRALNYALEALQAGSELPDLIGVLDADGRLHRDVLAEAAWRYLVKGSRILQGPVFQISNLDRVDLFGVMAGIELSVHHLSSMAAQLQSARHYPRFLAGTNYFICPRLLMEVGGWRSDALVEDAELGLRLFLRCRLRAEWLPSPELEQTAPSLAVYLRQRHRWALGHLQLLPQISREPVSVWMKLRLGWQVMRSMLTGPLAVLLPLLGWMLVLFHPPLFLASWPAAFSLVLLLLSLYTWDDFGRGLRLLNLQSPRPLPAWRLLTYSLALMLLMPCLMVIQLMPRLKALGQFVFSRRARLNQVVWYKTERSFEEVSL